jgi:hypothetical protein
MTSINQVTAKNTTPTVAGLERRETELELTYVNAFRSISNWVISFCFFGLGRHLICLSRVIAHFKLFDSS